jgi:hypothetical protein
VGPRAGLDAVTKRKVHSSPKEWNPNGPARNTVAKSSELSRLPVSSKPELKSKDNKAYPYFRPF